MYADIYVVAFYNILYMHNIHFYPALNWLSV